MMQTYRVQLEQKLGNLLDPQLKACTKNTRSG